MKNVVLLGDSIRVGYDKSVKASLEGVANVVFPNENNRFAAYLLRYLHDYISSLLPEEQVDVIHWNAGLWDCLRLFGEDVHTPIEIYAYYIDRICQRIVKLYPDAKVIFATSTSVLSEKMAADFKRYNEEIELYNRTAVEIVKKYGFTVNDMYAVSQTLAEDAHSDPVHYYTSAATKVFANQVLSYVCDAIEVNKNEIEYVEIVHKKAPVGI